MSPLQGLIFIVFSLSLVEALNLQPPPEWQLLGLPPPPQPGASPMLDPAADEAARRKKKRGKKGGKKRRGYDSIALGQSDDSDSDELEVPTFFFKHTGS